MKSMRISFLTLALCAVVASSTAQEVRYFKDYVENRGIPQGIGEVSQEVQAHRERTYKFLYQNGRLDSIALVNPEGRPAGHADLEHADSYIIAKINYLGNGKLDYVTAYDVHGKFIHNIFYASNATLASYRYNDPKATPKYLPLYTTYPKSANPLEKSRICGLRLSYNPDGQVIKKEYTDINGNAVADGNAIHGIEYRYGKTGYLTGYNYINSKGKTANDKFGHASTSMEYDADGNRIRTSYFDKDGHPSHNGNMTSIVENECDQYGNVTRETYRDIKGKPALRLDLCIAGIQYTLDGQGHRIKSTYLGTDGQPIYSNEGIMHTAIGYDANGYVNSMAFYDSRLQPAYNRSSGNFKVSADNDSLGRPVETTLLIDNGQGQYQPSSIIIRQEYDRQGNCVRQSYFADGMVPRNIRQGYHAEVSTYNSIGQMEKVQFLNGAGKAIDNFSGINSILYEYTDWGSVKSVRYLKANGENAMLDGNYHKVTYTYDASGLQTKAEYTDRELKPSAFGDFATLQSECQAEPNLPTTETTIDYEGRLVSVTRKEFNKLGLTTYILKTDKDGNKTAEEKYEYNDNGLLIRHWQLWSIDQKLHLKKYERDSRGNVVKESYFTGDGKADTIDSGMHCRTLEYNEKNLNTHVIYTDLRGRTHQMASVNNEEAYEYDLRGNHTKTITMDGSRNPINNRNGWCSYSISYDPDNLVTGYEYRTVGNKLTAPESVGWARMLVNYTQDGYTPHMRMIFDPDNKPLAFMLYSDGVWSDWITEDDLRQQGNN